MMKQMDKQQDVQRMRRVLGVLMAMVLLLASMTGASALTFSAWEDEIPPLAVSEKVAEQIAEDTAVENGFQLNDVTLLHAATKLVKADGDDLFGWFRDVHGKRYGIATSIPCHH